MLHFIVTVMKYLTGRIYFGSQFQRFESIMAGRAENKAIYIMDYLLLYQEAKRENACAGIFLVFLFFQLGLYPHLGQVFSP
jgi:hypothetical protein